MGSDAEEESFEALYRRLEETVAKLEAGGLALDEAIALYEEGTRLFQRCQSLLDSAQLRIARLQDSLTTVPSLAEFIAGPEDMSINDDA
jgi:exodeoxyribonuclease VII small subunit